MDDVGEGCELNTFFESRESSHKLLIKTKSLHNERMFDQETMTDVKRKIERMTQREESKSCIIYPENTAKLIWDLFVTVVLVACCFWTPWEMAFNIENATATSFNWTIDCIFLTDMIATFFTAYSTEDFEIIDDHKQIACVYLTSWFWIDLLAILPYAYMIPGS